MKLELDIVWHKIMTLTIVILLSINDGVSQSAVEQREQFFLEVLEHPENIKEQINGYARYRNDEDKQEFYRIYELTKSLINFEDSLKSGIDKRYALLMDSVKKKYANDPILGHVVNQVHQLESIDRQNQLHTFKTSLNPKFKNGMPIYFDPAVSFYLHSFLPDLRFRNSSGLTKNVLNRLDYTLGQLLSLAPNIQDISKSSYRLIGHLKRSDFINSLNTNLDEVYEYFTKSILYINQESKRHFKQPIYQLEKGAAFVKILRPISDFAEDYIPGFNYQYYAIAYYNTYPFSSLINLGDGHILEGEYYQSYFNDYANPYSSESLEEDQSFKRYWEAIERVLPEEINQLFFDAKGIYKKIMIETIMGPQGNVVGDVFDIRRNFEVNSGKVRTPWNNSYKRTKTFDLFGFPDYERQDLDPLPPKPKSFADMMFDQLDSDRSQEEKDEEIRTWSQSSQELIFKDNTKDRDRERQDSSINMNQEKALYNWVQELQEYISIDPGLPSESDSLLSPLLMSQHEVKVLNKLLVEHGFTGSYFLDTLATEQNLKGIQSPSVLHISTHAENDSPSEAEILAPDETKLYLAGTYYHLYKELILNNIKSKKEETIEKYKAGYDVLAQKHLYTKELQKLMLNARTIEGKKTVKDYIDSVSAIITLQISPIVESLQESTNGINDFNSSDGILDSNEIKNLNLYSTQLVTLATCGPINQYIPEYHTTSIAELFLRAGARHVVASFWPVNDEATTAFMLKFYKHWLDGSSERTALKKAQKDIREIPQFSHPYFWGGWMVYSRFYFNH